MKPKNSVPQREDGMTKPRKNEAGQALVVVALGLVALLAMMGLGIDMGYLRYQKGRIHAAADAAAIAGGAEILFSDINSAALAAAKVNGFADTSQGGTATVTVNHPPASGPHSGDDSYVEVLVSQNQPTFFMTVLGINSMPLQARSVAKGTSPNCLYALGPTTPAMTLTLAFITSQCGVIDNTNESGTIAQLRAPFIGVHGTVSGVTNNPAATTTAVAADPFASLTVPTNTDPTCTAHPTVTNVTATTTLNPGTYCGGIHITFPGAGGIVTLNPGTYYIYGGGFQMLGTFGASVRGNGVTIYNSGSGSGACGTCFGSITTLFTSGSALSAPTTGTYAGVLYFQDTANINSATFAANFSSGTNPFQQGAYYFKNAAVNFAFDFGSTAAYSILVAKSVTWTVAFTFGNDYSSLPKGAPIKNTGVLVE
jgi:hypothetical protein